jgi:hypothetical protein
MKLLRFIKSAGILLDFQQKVFFYLHAIDANDYWKQ